MTTQKPLISATDRQAILERIHTAWMTRSQRLARMKQLQTEGRKAACAAAEVLKAKFNVKRVVLFGSLLDHTKMHERSDIDIAVWGLPSDQLIKAGVAVDQASYEYGFGPIDLVPFEAAFPHIQTAILEYGVEL